MVDRQDCETCKNAFKIGPWDSDDAKKAKQNGPPCAACDPGVLFENLETFRVYNRCKNQWHLDSMGGLIAIRSDAVATAMSLCGTPETDRLAVFDGVMVISDIIADLRRKKTEAERNA